MTKSLFIGRFQPLHMAHINIIKKLLEDGKTVVVGVRNKNKTDKNNPFTYHQRHNMIRAVFPYEEEVEIIPLPDIKEVVHGRNPGWSIREIKVDQSSIHISATKLRGGIIIWLTGNSGSGKTTLSNALRHMFPSMINLDGDEMRATISTSEGFDYEDRKLHNERVARLAGLLRDQGHFVVVSLICPYQSIREAVTEIAGPIHWVHVERPSNDWRADEHKAKHDFRPFEKPPKGEYITVNSDKATAHENANKIMKIIMKRL